MPTPVSDTLVKRADESRLYDFDFGVQPEFEAGQTISGTPTITVTDGSGLTVGSVATSGARVQAQISGGTAGTTYTLKCTVVTSGGALLVEYGLLEVVD